MGDNNLGNIHKDYKPVAQAIEQEGFRVIPSGYPKIFCVVDENAGLAILYCDFTTRARLKIRSLWYGTHFHSEKSYSDLEKVIFDALSESQEKLGKNFKVSFGNSL
jgi:hypothetical protein